ncbi:MAG: beta galactosidase jelly roll domain-containing protein [Gammaproteobacteria bacterium]
MGTHKSERSLLLMGGWLAISLTVLGVVLHALYGYSIPFSGNAFGSDDAFISYRYAANLLAGNGLVFNVGDSVEGYSNLLYTLLIVPGFLFGHEHIYLFSLLLNCTLLIGCCLLLQRLINRHMGTLLSLIGVGLLALSPVLWANAATGLESVLMLFLVLATWSLLDLDRVRFPLLCSVALAAILCRVDGFTLPLLAAVYLWLDGRRGVAYRLVLFVVLVMLLYTLWRLFYYQDYIANTYHAKITGNLLERIQMGYALLSNNTRLNGIALYGLLTALCAVLWRSAARRHFFPLLYLAFSFAYFIYIGGDIYYERFLLAVIPIGIFFTLLLTVRLRNTAALLILPTIVLLAGMLVLVKDERFAYQVKRYDMWENLGLFLQKADPDALLAIDAAGKVPYYSELPTLDMLGLNDRHIGRRKMPEQPFITAHSKHDADYVLSRKPQLIASWIMSDLDLAWGMTSSKYLADYDVKYLVNTLLDSKGQDIIDVQGMTADQMKILIAERYNYGVLARRDVMSRLPQAYRLPGPPMLESGASVSFMDNSALPGWHAFEAEHRWTDGKQAKVLFRVQPNATYKGRLTLDFGSLGAQRVSLLLNGQPLGDYQLNSWRGRIDFTFDPGQLNREGTNTLEFKLPDAHAPGNGDPRVLAIAMRNLGLY